MGAIDTFDITKQVVRDGLRVGTLDAPGGTFTDGRLWRALDLMRWADKYAADDPLTCAAMIRHGASTDRALTLELGELRQDRYDAFCAHYGIR